MGCLFFPCSFWLMVITELKNEVRLPVYLIIRTMGGACEQQASPTKLPKKRNYPLGFRSPLDGFHLIKQPSFGSPVALERRFPPAMGLRAPERAGPRAPKVGPRQDQGRPKTAQNHHKRGAAAPRWAPRGSTFAVHGQMDRIHSGNVWAAFLSCCDRFLPQNGVH